MSREEQDVGQKIREWFLRGPIARLFSQCFLAVAYAACHRGRIGETYLLDNLGKKDENISRKRKPNLQTKMKGN